MMSRKRCPKCQKMLVSPAGPKDSPVVLVGEFPGFEEVKRGIPFVGRAGEVLRAELTRCGLPYTSCRVTNLWLHEKDEKGCDLNFHLTEMAKEIAPRRFALLMGSDLAAVLWRRGVMELSSLEMTHELFPGVRLFVSPNPAAVLSGTIGEFRLALQKFSKAVGGDE